MRVLPTNPMARTALGRLPVRVYVVAAGVLCVVLLAVFLYVQPHNRAMAAVRAEIRDRQASLQLLEVELAKLEASRRRLQQLDSAIQTFEGTLPQQGEIDVILREVWVIADTAGLKTQRIKTQKERLQGAYRVLPIEMNLHGRFEGLYSFMLSLEKLSGATQIQSLRISVSPNDPDGGLDASIVLNVFCKA